MVEPQTFTVSGILKAAIAQNFNVRASSEHDSNHGAAHCMLNQKKSRAAAGAWCASDLDSNQWIAVGAPGPKRFVKVATQGRSDCA